VRLQEDFGSWFVEGEGYKDVLRYASIPIVAALIGYGTNVLAIQMTFLPLEYLGFGEAFFHKWGFSLGWQVHGTHAGHSTLRCTGRAAARTRTARLRRACTPQTRLHRASPPPAVGWQGIIPSKAEKMARKACFMITTKLMNLRDVFEKVRHDGYPSPNPQPPNPTPTPSPSPSPSPTLAPALTLTLRTSP
jgi:hypothetical protein